MKKLFTLLVCFFSLVGIAQKRNTLAGPDLTTTIDQSAFTKILDAADIPMVLFEHREPFPGLLNTTSDDFAYNDSTDKNYTYEETKNLFKWAVNDAKITGLEDDKNNIFRGAIREAWRNLYQEVNNVYNQATTDTRTTNEDFSLKDLEKLKNELYKGNVDNVFSFFETKLAGAKAFAKIHLAYARVDLLDRPVIDVNSPDFAIGNVRVRATATGELWLKLPYVSCCPLRAGFRWVKTASVTVSPVIGAAAAVHFSIESLKVMATGRFTRLFLDYPILRDINLAGIGNHYLSSKQFELYDVSKFVASIPYIDKKFAISTIDLPAQTHGVKVDITITKK